jgi:hypothetical protein
VSLVVMLALSLVVVANGIGLGAAFVHPEVEVGGFLGAIDRFGPPLFTAVAAAVAAWNPHVEPAPLFVAAVLRLALWAVAGVVLLLVLFRRGEIES